MIGPDGSLPVRGSGPPDPFDPGVVGDVSGMLPSPRTVVELPGTVELVVLDALVVIGGRSETLVVGPEVEVTGSEVVVSGDVVVVVSGDVVVVSGEVVVVFGNVGVVGVCEVVVVDPWCLCVVVVQYPQPWCLRVVVVQ
jgi:hypothetical protein